MAPKIFQTLAERYGINKPNATDDQLSSPRSTRRKTRMTCINRDVALNVVIKLIDEINGKTKVCHVEGCDDDDAIERRSSQSAAEFKKFKLVSFADYSRHNRGLTSKVYAGYHILCHNRQGPHLSAGFAVCNHVLSGTCFVSNGLKSFDTEIGTTLLRNHLKMHEGRDSVNILPVTIPKRLRHDVINAAGEAVAHGLLPMSFASKKCLIKFASSLIEIGKFIDPSTHVDAKSLLPTAPTVRSSILSQAAVYRKRVKDRLGVIMKTVAA